MTAPSIKEALELTPEQISIINDMIHAWIDEDKIGEFRQAFRDDCKRLLRTALATLSPPDGERREAIARILSDPKHNERARFVQGFLYGDDHVIRDVARREKQELFRTKDEAAYEQRLEIERSKFAADAILASGLVQDEAAIRADEREKCAQKLEAMDDCSPRFIADAIRSARDGGAES